MSPQSVDGGACIGGVSGGVSGGRVVSGRLRVELLNVIPYR